MPLTEIKKVDQIEIVGEYTIQVRTATIIEKDGVEISRTFNRHVLEPGMDISQEEDRVKSIANAIWTQEVIDSFQAGLADSISNNIN